ncbi:MAG: endonuclease/exonuclease/phosphatase family protein [Bacteroidales bacterium]|nr:endonuclease/exonuclease/phosphatase family protein [Bacteroidales bacterium]
MYKRLFMMNRVVFFMLFLIGLLNISVYAQKGYKTAVVAFYNLENLYDTEDDPLIDDEEFLPNGVNQWREERYQHKLMHLSEVIDAMAKEKGCPIVIGTSEIENEKVMLDLASTETLKPYHFGVVHHDSPDRRGVDVAFLYNKDRFRVLAQRAFRVKYPQDTSFRTRDQLLMSGIVDNMDTLHLIVNHWPSKRGGEKRSMPLRMAAADLTRHIVDSLLAANANAKIIVLGDLNDNPDAKSITEKLRGKGKIKNLLPGDLFNPMWQMYRDGLASYYYHDMPEMIDNIIVSQGLLQPDSGVYHYSSAHVFRKNFMITQTGSFAGYPFRTYAGGSYAGGYSDHFPVYVILNR